MDEKITFNYSKLKGRIIEMYGTQTDFIDNISISEVTFIKKIKKGYFTQQEIEEIMLKLDVPLTEVYAYFFTV